MLYRERWFSDSSEPHRRTYELHRESGENQYVGMLEERNRREVLHLMVPDVSPDTRFHLAQQALEWFPECEAVEVNCGGHPVAVTRAMTRGAFELLMDELGITDDEYGRAVSGVEYPIGQQLDVPALQVFRGAEEEEKVRAA